MARARIREIGAVRRVVFKVGSSLLTEEHRLSEPRIDALAAQIARFADRGGSPLVVSSGAVAAGMGRLRLPRRPRTIPEKQAAAAIGQSHLMWAYEQAFARHDIQVAQVLLTGDVLTDRRRFTNAQNTLTTLLEHRVVPIVNENDTVAVEEIQVGDNDTLSAAVACLVGADLLVILSDVEGLFTGDPRRDPAARLIPTVRGLDTVRLEGAQETGSVVGTGGMVTKLKAAARVNDFGIPMVVASGQDLQILERLFAGDEVGTLFVPAGRRLAAKKHWIRHTLVPAGDIVIDAGAARALHGGGKSLLAAGVTGARGTFAAGDPVRIIDHKGREVGRGLTTYGSADIERISGLSTSKLRCLDCHRGDEVIHCDRLVISAKP